MEQLTEIDAGRTLRRHSNHTSCIYPTPPLLAAKTEEISPVCLVAWSIDHLQDLLDEARSEGWPAFSPSINRLPRVSDSLESPNSVNSVSGVGKKDIVLWSRPVDELLVALQQNTKSAANVHDLNADWVNEIMLHHDVLVIDDTLGTTSDFAYWQGVKHGWDWLVDGTPIRMSQFADALASGGNVTAVLKRPQEVDTAGCALCQECIRLNRQVRVRNSAHWTGFTQILWVQHTTFADFEESIEAEHWFVTDGCRVCSIESAEGLMRMQNRKFQGMAALGVHQTTRDCILRDFGACGQSRRCHCQDQSRRHPTLKFDVRTDGPNTILIPQTAHGPRLLTDVNGCWLQTLRHTDHIQNTGATTQHAFLGGCTPEMWALLLGTVKRSVPAAASAQVGHWVEHDLPISVGPGKLAICATWGNEAEVGGHFGQPFGTLAGKSTDTATASPAICQKGPPGSQCSVP